MLLKKKRPLPKNKRLISTAISPSFAQRCRLVLPLGESRRGRSNPVLHPCLFWDQRGLGPASSPQLAEPGGRCSVWAALPVPTAQPRQEFKEKDGDRDHGQPPGAFTTHAALSTRSLQPFSARFLRWMDPGFLLSHGFWNPGLFNESGRSDFIHFRPSHKSRLDTSHLG